MNNTYSVPKFETNARIFNYKNIIAGKLVQKYNIFSAHLENYFIPTADLSAFDLARSKQDLNAHKKYGKQIII